MKTTKQIIWLIPVSVLAISIAWASMQPWSDLNINPKPLVLISLFHEKGIEVGSNDFAPDTHVWNHGLYFILDKQKLLPCLAWISDKGSHISETGFYIQMRTYPKISKSYTAPWIILCLFSFYTYGYFSARTKTCKEMCCATTA